MKTTAKTTVKKPRELYRMLCEASNLDAAVGELSVRELTQVAEYITRLKGDGGLPAQVWGVVSQALNALTKEAAR